VQIDAFERECQKAVDAEKMAYQEALLAAKPEAIV
jgi:hypothetical protein